jgi:response regulator RpfG family c-di-GMP phosphodiesterase
MGGGTAGNGRHRLSVLVVDDDRAHRQLVAGWVEALELASRDAATAARAVELVAEEPADILLCNVRLRDSSGVWLASRVRETHPHTAIVMVSAERDVETAVASLRNDVADYLIAPFDQPRLAEALALAREWHAAATGTDDLQASLQDRLRTRRAALAPTLAGAQDTPEDALEGLMSMLQFHERDGRGHATRVARLAVALGDAIGLDGDALLTLEHGALLHDIGKLDVPASILSKPAPLDAREWEVMREHPQLGYDLLSHQPRFAAAADIVLSHHEAFDGSGYPRGLGGDDIPLAARILTVADAFDSMTHPHTQRPALPPALAADEIVRCSGSQFDPECVKAFGSVL